MLTATHRVLKRFSTFNNKLVLVAYLSNYPSHTVIPMPALSPTMANGTISKWNCKVGDKITAGDSYAEVETDKASMVCLS